MDHKCTVCSNCLGDQFSHCMWSAVKTPYCGTHGQIGALTSLGPCRRLCIGLHICSTQRHCVVFSRFAGGPAPPPKKLLVASMVPVLPLGVCFALLCRRAASFPSPLPRSLSSSSSLLCHPTSTSQSVFFALFFLFLSILSSRLSFGRCHYR